MKKIKILISNAEQLPYSFSEDIETERKYLETGDYLIEGHEKEFCIERKSLDDYVRSVTTDGDRFFKEIKRLQKYPIRYIIVEGNVTEILAKKYSSEYSPDNILGLTYAIMLIYNVPVLFLKPDRHLFIS